MKQKPIEDMKFDYSVEVALKCLWAIKDENQFYFMEYGKSWLNKIVDQRVKKVLKSRI